MRDDCKIEQRIGFVKSPWLSVPTKGPCDLDFEEWFPKQRPAGRIYFYEFGLNSPVPVAVLVNENLESTFRELASQWKEETWFQSSVKRRMSHQAYLKIIGMGAAALPFIFNSLREEPDHWFGALEAITRENPAPHAENMHQLRDAWLEWALSHGY